ncbi:hypothetical protein CDA63_07595 [Hymenobacter amundsenii]|uniref:Uncharacterized protein n=1 Tax=Hymenobacter amundsenii TaxID=2006685 RepID=A0A246FLL8_9BACT|nr:hypothetical protein [Hymenobacter amundsenii]OWP63647.1 hypothetical protein CDA63_07595 [Hymenobacter amundsenii]
MKPVIFAGTQWFGHFGHALRVKLTQGVVFLGRVMGFVELEPAHKLDFIGPNRGGLEHKPPAFIGQRELCRRRSPGGRVAREQCQVGLGIVEIDDDRSPRNLLAGLRRQSEQGRGQ